MVKFTAIVLATVLAASLLVGSNGFVSTSLPSTTQKTQLHAEESDDKFFPAPSLAQTHMQGPLTPATGSGKALTKEQLDDVKKELEEIKKKGGLTEPTRSFMDDEDIKWRFGGAPDYSLANLLFLKGRSHVHPEGSLEQVVVSVKILNCQTLSDDIVIASLLILILRFVPVSNLT